MENKIIQNARKYIKPSPQKPIIRIRVLDFNIWNGFKFGFGLAMGVAGFFLTASIAGFLLKTFIFGLFVSSKMGGI